MIDEIMERGKQNEQEKAGPFKNFFLSGNGDYTSHRTALYDYADVGNTGRKDLGCRHSDNSHGNSGISLSVVFLQKRKKTYAEKAHVHSLHTFFAWDCGKHSVFDGYEFVQDSGTFFQCDSGKPVSQYSVGSGLGVGHLGALCGGADFQRDGVWRAEKIFW